MRKSPIFPAVGSVFILAGGLVAIAPAAAADSTPDGNQPLLEALDPDRSDAAAAEALDQQAEAADLEEHLRADLGAEFAGAVVDTDTGELTVHVTDASAAAAVSETPADVHVETVTHGEDALADAVADLDAAAAETDSAVMDSVTRWAPEIERDAVVIEALRGSTDAAAEFAEAAGVDLDLVEIEVTTERPQMLQDVIGGEAYNFGPGGRCSIGHAVEGGFATAGHCGSVGTPTSNPTGTVAGSVFPGSDGGWVQTNANTTPLVNLYQHGGYATVVGSQEAPIGAEVCRSGSTTGTYCGHIQGKNETVNYAEGAVHGLTRTNVCAEPGDSGGSWITPYRDAAQAQGVTSGGSGNCSFGGTTYYQPLNPILNEWNLTLVTG